VHASDCRAKSATGGGGGKLAGNRSAQRQTTAVETNPSAVHVTAHFSQEAPVDRLRSAASMTERE